MERETMKKGMPKLINLIILLSLLFTSCTSENDSPTSTQPATAKQALAATTPKPKQTERTIVDLSGRTVTIPAVVNRVATSFPATNQMIYMLGAGDKIVATVMSLAKNKMLVKIYPRFAAIPTPFGGTGIRDDLFAGERGGSRLPPGSYCRRPPLRRVRHRHYFRRRVNRLGDGSV